MLWWQYGLGKDLCIHVVLKEELEASQGGVRGDLNFLQQYQNVSVLSCCSGGIVRLI